MIKTDQIDEWIQEVESRPGSAPVIIRYVANRLRDLTARNEELLAENIALRSGRKVEEYENKIANLEYQMEILRRQLGGAVIEGAISLPAAVETLSVIVYQGSGRVLRFEYGMEELKAGSLLAAAPQTREAGAPAPRLLITNPTEELLFVFDSGRTESAAVASLPVAESGKADWKRGYLVEPRGGEELVVVLPIGKMTLFDYCVQSSRRGCVKKIMKTSLEQQVLKNFIGTGIKQKPDKMGGLVLCGKDERFAMVSKEGWLVGVDVPDMSFSAEETLRLSATDHIVSGFVLGKKPNLVAVTRNGKAVVREVSWIEKAGSGKGRGQAIFSQARREAGVRLAGAAAADENDWGAALYADASVRAFRMKDVFASGALESDTEAEIAEFITFNTPGLVPVTGKKG